MKTDKSINIEHAALRVWRMREQAREQGMLKEVSEYYLDYRRWGYDPYESAWYALNDWDC